ncbi:MAG: inositol monophosphatase [Desulfobacteraceae bacterium]|nr:MAG: inositol monophosphatase [Desulfobacteraceae bacterium]
MGSERFSDVESLSRFAAETLKKLGTEALSYYGRGRTDVKFDEDLVTAAELHLVRYFQDALKSEYPEHRSFAEPRQNEDYTHAESRYLWIHDAIDGVDNFQTGIPVWGMSLALLENFWPILGSFYMPATGDFFHARADQPAYRGDRQIHASNLSHVDDESLLFTYSRFNRHYLSSFPGKIRDLGCTTAHICYVAMGRADAAIIANESYKGLAAARVIIEAAGGKILKMDGGGFFLNEYMDGQKIEDHLLVASRANFSSVCSCLKRIG